ncbi:MAG: hypothetical protein ACP5IL_07560 [Syntrophobacteraceae bacterium]
MKKENRKNPYEDKADPMRELGMDLDEDDEDIIELEDIIEMPDRPIDEEEDLDLGADIFDVDDALQSSPARSSRKPVSFLSKERTEEIEDADLLDSIVSESHADEGLFEPSVSESRGKSPQAKAAPEFAESQEDVESILNGLLDEPVSSEPRREAKGDVKTPAQAGAQPSQDMWPQEAAIPATPKASPRAVSGPSVSELSALAEELIGGLEARLKEHIRTVVETMLPGLVRSIIDEEITKLKEELE